VHCAPTVEQAYAEVRYGIEQWFRYFQSVAAFPQMVVDGNDPHEMTEFVNQSGIGVIGTPEMVAAQIERLDRQSNGGFGAYLMLAHEWADPDATKRSFELVARNVMPHFQGHYRPTMEATERARAVRGDLAGQQAQAVEAMKAKYEAERSERR
jgi:limonene 1,2-monooxygenase